MHLLKACARIVLTGVHGKNGMTGSLSQKFSDGKWKAAFPRKQHLPVQN